MKHRFQIRASANKEELVKVELKIKKKYCLYKPVF